MIEKYSREVTIDYKGEKYSVRDNGAIFKHARNNERKRPTDEVWTFGKVNSKGYLAIAGETIHRIVCFAFHGEPDTAQHIVDHIDTNRQNNRPENLRWLTKLENILNNPITKRRIEIQCGSIEEFLKDPSCISDTSQDPNFEWMRRVTPEEAKATLERLLEWAKSDSMPKGGKLGEWVFETSDKFESTGESLTKNVIQKKWNTPSLFPQCPESNINNPLKVYFDNLKQDVVFSTNKYGESVVMKRALSEDGKTLYVMTFNEKNFLKQFALATVTYEDGFFIHESKGSYFEEQGAEKYYTLEQGLEWTGGDGIDDYA